MNQHPSKWIEAYADGQLHGEKLHLVEQHLINCPACQAEVARAQDLSTLLHEWPPFPGQTTAEIYANLVVHKMPGQPAAPALWKALKTGWQLAPLAVVAMWAFGHAIMLVSSLILLILNTNSTSQTALTALSLFNLIPQGYSLLESLTSIFIDQAGQPFSWMMIVEGLASGLSLSLVVTLITAGLLWGWLASWWASARRLAQPEAGLEYKNQR